MRTVLICLCLSAAAVPLRALAEPTGPELVGLLKEVDDRQRSSGDYKALAYIEQQEKEYERAMDELMQSVDLYVSPTFAGDNLLRTNLTGHPAVVLPNGFRASDGTPTSITFTGRLFGETELLQVAAAWQDATGFHTRHPAGGAS